MLNFVAICVTILASAIPGPQAGNVESARIYASEAPYGNVAMSKFRKPPEGYTLFFIETVGRHGSRASVNDADEKQVLKFWKQAKDADALTPNGEQLKDDI